VVAVMEQPLTTAEAARVAGVSEGSIRAWMKAGKLPHQTTPLGRLVDPIALAEVIAERERQQCERVRVRQVSRRTQARIRAALDGSGEREEPG
jgi:predicted site-specific integrase-resolvase